MDSLDASQVQQQNRRLTAAVELERQRLWSFIRRRAPNRADAEEILQEVFGELVEAYRLLRPIEQLSAWLFTVARNRIIDRLRKRRSEQGQAAGGPLTRTGAQHAPDEAEHLGLEELLPAPDAGPESAFMRTLLLEQLALALDELPPEQRQIFIAHEIEGRPFSELAAASGVPLNTLLSRKRYAVLHLRARLQSIHDEWTL